MPPAFAILVAQFTQARRPLRGLNPGPRDHTTHRHRDAHLIFRPSDLPQALVEHAPRQPELAAQAPPFVYIVEPPTFREAASKAGS